MTSEHQVLPLSEIMDTFKSGRPVIMVDDADRENEGDIVIASEVVTAEHMAFMMEEARGLICVTLSADKAEMLNLPLQVRYNNSPYQTAFTVSVDSKSVQQRGVEAAARATTVRALQSADSKASDFVAPGHVFPLIAHRSGVLGRRGQTEGSFDLARLSGFSESAVICEILNPDGSMARGAELYAFAKKHDLLITSVEEVLRYRIHEEILIRKMGCVDKETDFGVWKAYVFEDDVDGKEHLALVYGDPETAGDSGLLVRIHSECLTGDVFSSRRCDCGEQLRMSMQEIVSQGAGAILYLRQEGRGIGLANKLMAYELQDQGHDTVEANLKLGFAADERDFGVAAKILQQLGIRRVRLMTNNPVKLETLESSGITIVDRVSVKAAHDEFCAFYIETKKNKLGHLL